VQIDRQDLVLELNISYRDVRILDPLVSGFATVGASTASSLPMLLLTSHLLSAGR
jgi:hypothetical protein